jgi:hypothetical protein
MKEKCYGKRYIYNIQRILALSDLYFRLADNTGSDNNSMELIETREGNMDSFTPAESKISYMA